MWLLYIVIFILFSFSEAHKVAIIGAGPSGSSLAYYLKRVNKDIDITIFEQGSEIAHGLRIDKVSSQSFNPSIFFSSDQLLKGLLEKHNLDMKPVDETRGLWDGQNWIHYPSFSWDLDWLKLIWRYRMSYFSLNRLHSSVAEKWAAQYKDSKPWETIPDFIKRFALKEESSHSVWSLMTREVGNRLMDQDELICAFSSPTSWVSPNTQPALFGLMSSTYLSQQLTSPSLQQLFKTLARESKAKVLLKTKVTSIELDYQMETEDEESGCSTLDTKFLVKTNHSEEVFDYLVFATKLDHSEISINGCNWVSGSKSVPLYHTFVKGELDLSSFQVSDVSSFPSFVHFHSNNSMNKKIKSISKTTKEDILVFYSQEPLQRSDLLSVFRSVSWHETVETQFRIPSENGDPLILDSNLFYLQSFNDAIGDTLESSLISARNVARLLGKKAKNRC